MNKSGICWIYLESGCQGLYKKLKQAPAFYTLILFSTGVVVGLDVAGINPVKALYWTAVINGLFSFSSQCWSSLRTRN